MPITLGALTLPEDLIWTDEFAYSAMARTTNYAVDGSLHRAAALKKKGRPITLSGDASSAWVDRGDLQALWDLLATDTVMALTLNDGRVFDVAFAPDDTPVTAAPLVDYSTPAADDFYISLVIKLIQV
jgi:hypothetical protein